MLHIVTMNAVHIESTGLLFALCFRAFHWVAYVC